tara:strand:+ start:1653 stop:1922 length:270 start_codon:yes stop_codon:yes gene_type:complete
MDKDTEINMNGPFGIFLKVFLTCMISLIVFVVVMLGYTSLNYTGSYKVRTHTAEAERPSRSNEGQYDHVIEAVKKHEAKYKYIGDGDGF